MSQQADGSFGGPGTPQSPLLSPRMAHTQSPMMQQSQQSAAFQGSPDMNGWPQGNMGPNRYSRLMTERVQNNYKLNVLLLGFSINKWRNLTFSFYVCLSSSSMFSQQQASPQFSQQSNIYNGNGMSLNSVPMTTNMATSSMSSMGQIAGQMSSSSMGSGPSPGLPSIGQEQVIPHTLFMEPEVERSLMRTFGIQADPEKAIF